MSNETLNGLSFNKIYKADKFNSDTEISIPYDKLIFTLYFAFLIISFFSSKYCEYFCRADGEVQTEISVVYPSPFGSP